MVRNQMLFLHQEQGKNMFSHQCYSALYWKLNKFIWKRQKANICHNEEEQCGRTDSNLKTHCNQKIQYCKVGAKSNNGSLEQNRELRSRPIQIWSANLLTKRKCNPMEKALSFSTNGDRTVHAHTKKENWHCHSDVTILN